MNNFGNFCFFYLWDFHWNSWAEYQKKSENMFLDGKEDK